MCRIIIKKIGDLEDIEKKFISENSKYFQSLDWADIGSKLGRAPEFILFYAEGEIKNSWLFFTLDMPFSLFRYREMRLETEPICYDGADAMLKFLVEHCKEKRYDNILFQTNMSNWTIGLNDCPLNFYVIEDFGTYIIDLSENPDAIFKNMHKKHRNVIRKAVKLEYYIIEDKSDEALDDFFNLVNETYRRSNKFGYSKEYLKTILSSEYSRLFSCYSPDAILTASALVIGDKNQAYYLHGGSVINSDGASNLLHYDIIRKLKEYGYEKYDLGGVSHNPAEGSKAYGIKTFKSRFGGEFMHVYRGQIRINKTKTQLIASVRKVYNSSYYLKRLFYKVG